MNLRIASCLAVPVLCAGLLARADVPAVGPVEPGAKTEQPHPPPEPAAAQPAEPEKPAIAPPKTVYDEAFDRVLDRAQNGWMQDPLKHLEGDMSHVVGELTAYKTDKPVQKVQDKVTGRLDALIKILEKECNGSSAGGGASPTKPLGKSVLAKGPGGQGEMHDPKAGDKQWASLPPKQREQILQSRTEGFPPGFESLLQNYYQRLAQEQVGDGAPAAAASQPEAGEAAPGASDATAVPAPGAPAPGAGDAAPAGAGTDARAPAAEGGGAQ